MQIKLVRHGQSMANIGLVDAAAVGDHAIQLTDTGHAQARAAGARIGRDYLHDALIYTSPFRRARDTLGGILEGAALPREQVTVYEDPRLREVEHGYADVPAQDALRRTHGWFYYRFHGGESPADCYDRTSGFLESLMRQAQRKQAERVLVVTHGLTIRCFVMRFLHLSVEQFATLANPDNSAIVTLASRASIAEPLFAAGRWAVDGLRLREESQG